MPKLPRISAEEAIRVFERLGFYRARQRGSHIVLRRDSGGCVVPNHRELKVGTLAGVLKHKKPAIAFSGGVALLYAVLYGVLQSEDNALLMGSLVMFAALAAVMILTRRMDWYRLGGQ